MANEQLSTGSRSDRGFFNRVIFEGFLFQGSLVLQAIGGIAMVALALISFLTVFSRVIGLSGTWLLWTIDLSELLMGIVSAFGIAICWYKSGHLRVDILISRVSPRIKNAIEIVSAILFLLWSAAMAWAGWGQAIEDLKFKTATLSASIPIAPFKILFFLAVTHFAIVLLRSTWLLVTKIRGRPVEHGSLY
jgi:TRAP-type C4-dicarboxylate transport system permease small subunit